MRTAPMLKSVKKTATLLFIIGICLQTLPDLGLADLDDGAEVVPKSGTPSKKEAPKAGEPFSSQTDDDSAEDLGAPAQKGEPKKGAVAKEPKLPSEEPTKTSADKKHKKNKKTGLFPEPTKEGEKDKKPNEKAEPAKRGQVHFKSRGVSGIKDRGTVELIQDVVVTQDDMRLEADKAVAYFDEETDEIIRIVATGNVRINRDDPDPKKNVKATGEEAIFYNSEQKVILQGRVDEEASKKMDETSKKSSKVKKTADEGGAKLWRGEDLIRGKRITYELLSGRVTADNVEGVLKPGDGNK